MMSLLTGVDGCGGVMARVEERMDGRDVCRRDVCRREVDRKGVDRRGLP